MEFKKKKFHIVKNLKVVNDTAKWGIKLTTDYSNITKNKRGTKNFY